MSGHEGQLVVMPFLVTDGEFTAVLGMFGVGFASLAAAVAKVYSDQQKTITQNQLNLERNLQSSAAATEAIKDTNRILERLAKAQEVANARAKAAGSSRAS